ncbi:hypothetical protein FK498_01180 [Elioraea sp. Yellowstone]|uniref:NUDIX domain-containing protein n=1 Tax=Elioraea sp. Yellowstone TaxID=2592070 RepID=UPI001154A183|nr:NUDIX domain-containing protein [Elioraea sp. Yellowstone]TQF84826.1 hypothetical protein FK498_01180 [Elioraea sp. Yellowstone]
MADASVSGPRVRTAPAGDTRARQICPECGFVACETPEVAVGSVAVHDSRVLLCRRAIMPRRGGWTLPAGLLELGEAAGESLSIGPTEESGEVGLFGREEIPWDDIAFPPVRRACSHWQESAGAASWPARGNPVPA